MTATERDEMEELIQFIEEHPGARVPIDHFLNILYGLWPTWAIDMYHSAKRTAYDTTSSAVTIRFLELLRESLQTEPTCNS